MKKQLALLCLSAALVVTLTPYQSRADLLVYEGFDYAAGTDLTGTSADGGLGFTTFWGNNSSGTTVVGNQNGDWVQAGSLSYTDMLGNTLVTSGNSLFLTGSNGTSSPFRTFTQPTASTIWVSVLSYRSGTTTNNTLQPDNPYPRAGNFSLFEGNSERVALGNSSAATNNVFSLIPSGSLNNRVPTTNSFSQLALMVMRVDYGTPDTNDVAYLFMNPTLGVEPALLDASAMTNSFDFDFSRMRPFAGGNSANQPFAEMYFDEIRIGTTYADVTPFIPIPEPSSLALGLAGALGGYFFLRRRRE